MLLVPPPFRYHRPHTAEQAAELLRVVPGSVVLAGGQTLVNALKLDLVSPTAVVDIHRLPELRTVTRAGHGLRIGAACTYAELAADPIVREVVPAVADMAGGLVDRQVRNRGTIGGNVSLNDPTNNFPPLLAALDARFELLTPEGSQLLAAEDFFLGALWTAASDGALLVAVHVDPLPTGAALVHRHQQLARDSWALARAVVRLDVVDGSVQDARAHLGAVPGSPLQLPRVTAALTGQRLSPDLVGTALAAFDTEQVQTLGDTHGSAGYRLTMARVQLRRALTAAIEELHP